MKFGKFIKRATIDIVIARNSYQGEAAEYKLGDEFLERSAIIYLHPDFAKEMGFREGDIVELESDEKTIRVRVAYSDTAPEKGGLMPNSIFSNYFVGKNKKRFVVAISPSNASVTTIDELIFSNTN